MHVQDVQFETRPAGVLDLGLEVAADGVEEGGGAGAEGEREEERLFLSWFGVLHSENFHAFDHFRLHVFVEAALAQRFFADGDGRVDFLTAAAEAVIGRRLALSVGHVLWLSISLSVSTGVYFPISPIAFPCTIW